MKTQRISKQQALLIAITSITAAVFKPLFRDFLLWSGNGSWASIILATGFSVVILLLVLRLAARFPRQSAAEYLPVIWGKLIGYPLAFILLLTFFLKGAFTLRNVSEFFVTAILPETPISAVMIIMLILVAGGILAQLEGIVRFNQLALPIIIFGFALVFLGSLPRFSGWNLLPAFNKGYRGLLHPFQTASSYLLNSTFIMFVYPLIVDPERIAKEACKMLAVAGGLMLAIYLNIVLFLGSSLGQVFTWPYLAVVENIQIGVERGEAIFMVVWMLAAFVTISLFLYIFALGTTQLIPGIKLWWVGIAAIPAAAYVALLPNNLPSALVDHTLLHEYALYLQVAIPLLSLGLAIVRRQRGEQFE